jgi:hypothetical protein
MLRKLSIEHGMDQAAVMKAAIDALREKRAYAAKRSIERPFQPPPLDLIVDASDDRARDYFLDGPKREGLRGLIKSDMDTELILDSLIREIGGPAAARRDVVTRKTQVIFFSELFITALEEALDYDPKRLHNAPPPALRLDDEGYLKEIRTLIGELKRLNENLERAAIAETKPKAKRTSAPRKAAEKSAIQVSTHVNTFLNKYASALGTGAAVLTIGTAGALLQQLGVPFDTITKAFRR